MAKCKLGAACDRQGCPFQHPASRTEPVKQEGPAQPSEIRWVRVCNDARTQYGPDYANASGLGTCKYGSKCNNARCVYTHPSSRPKPDAVTLDPRFCRWGSKCNNPRCYLEHQTRVTGIIANTGNTGNTDAAHATQTTDVAHLMKMMQEVRAMQAQILQYLSKEARHTSESSASPQ